MVSRKWTSFQAIIGFGLALAAGLFTDAPVAQASNVIAPNGLDKHYTKVGFFDIHVCNWPDRDPFFLILFSTYEFKDVEKVEVFYPDGEKIGELDLDRFRVIAPKPKKKKPEKRVFIKHFDIRADKPEGRYYARVTMKNQPGVQYGATDYVVQTVLDRAQNRFPAADAEDIALPKRLSWDKIQGAKYYKVFVRDVMEEKLIFQTKLLKTPYVDLPKDLLQPGGVYKWQVHARDVNVQVDLGDFNAGSLTDMIEFSVAEE